MRVCIKEELISVVKSEEDLELAEDMALEGLS